MRVSSWVGPRNAVDVIDTIEGLAQLAAATGRMEQAARLIGAAAGLREEIAMPLMPAESLASSRFCRRCKTHWARKALPPP